MYQFSRAIRLAPGDPRSALTWAQRITEKVNQISEVPFTLWSAVLSPQVGTLAWSGVFAALREVEAVQDKLNSDDGFLSLVAEGAKYTSADGATDRLVRTLHLAGQIDPGHLEYVQAVSLTPVPGHTARAVAFAIDIAERTNEAIGCASSVGRVLTGPQMRLQLATYCSSIDQVEQGEKALLDDPEFMARVDSEGAEVIMAGGVEVMVVRKLA
jgi:hypothetical protein